MAKVIYHLTEDGPKKCTAAPGNCPLGGEHVEGFKEANLAYEREMGGNALDSFKKPSKSAPLRGFSDESHYGEWSPRQVQLEALNGVMHALEEDDATQLVAACGTGKTYMGRQLMRHQMEQEGANGVAIVLTSSIRLATDTAAELRPNQAGAYDKSFGELHKDYEVIEIHSDSNAVTTEGAVDIDKIARQWNEALEAGKKVVIVSTYQSADKVKAVQERLGERAEADLLMNDEAHNILGQKNNSSKRRSQPLEGEENEGEDEEASQNFGYVSFHNEIPGAIQAKKRLYATATPVIPEPNSQKPTINSEETALEDLKRYAENDIKANDRLRMTVFSTDPIVGKIGGFITKADAVKEKCLADSSYQLRPATVHGVNSPDELVDYRGIARGPASKKVNNFLSAQTYAATVSTLEAMIEDPGKESNGSHNALVYASGIAQAEAFKENFGDVAKHLSGNMELSTARANVNSDDPELRRKARMRLLAEEANVLVAHSESPKGDKEAAFAMFKGKDVKQEEAENGWSPKKNILSNVDIFSEGVSLNEIDTVVIANPSKTSERALTQAAGRAARKVGGNEYKSVGHVIIPQVLNDDGEELNGTFVNRAVYGASSLERSVTVKSLSGVAVPEDNSTVVKVYGTDGSSQEQKAFSLVHKHDSDVDSYLAAQTIDLVKRNLTSGGKRDSEQKRAEVAYYRSLTPEEKEQFIRTKIAEKAESVLAKDSGAHWARANSVLQANKHKSLESYRQAAIVPALALGKSDFTFVNKDIRERLVKSRAIVSKDSTVQVVTTSDKAEFLKARRKEVITAIVHPYAVGSESKEVQQLVAAVTDGQPDRNAFRYLNTGSVGSSTKLNYEAKAAVERYEANLDRLLSNPEFVEKTYNALGSQDKNTAKAFSTVKDVLRRKNIDLDSEMQAVEKAATERKSQKVSEGEAGFVCDSRSFTNGYLSAEALNRFASID